MNGYARNDLLAADEGSNTRRFVTDAVAFPAEPRDKVLRILFSFENVAYLQKKLQDSGYGTHTADNVMTFLNREYEQVVMGHSFHFPLQGTPEEIASEVNNRAFRAMIQEISSFRKFDRIYQNEISIVGTTRPLNQPKGTMFSRGNNVIFNRW